MQTPVFFMRWAQCVALCLIGLVSVLWPHDARADKAGEFDYYVMALSWQPNWCLREGDARGAETCETGARAGWTLHGLWPQHENGWPEYCTTSQRDPSRRMTGEMSDIMGSGGLAWHQWKKHGRCSGLSAQAYLELSREAYDRINRPEVLRKVKEPITLPAKVIEEAFLQSNPALAADGITITCRNRMVAEARICLTKTLAPRRCGADVRRDCSLDNAYFAPLR